MAVWYCVVSHGLRTGIYLPQCDSVPWFTRVGVWLGQILYVFCQFTRQCQRCHYLPETCRKISGIYTAARLRRGYHVITEIPRGTCSFNVTELKQSNNYLALKTESRKNIINSRRRIDSPGIYSIAGATITYHRNRDNCPGECINAIGPLNETIILQNPTRGSCRCSEGYPQSGKLEGQTRQNWKYSFNTILKGTALDCRNSNQCQMFYPFGSNTSSPNPLLYYQTNPGIEYSFILPSSVRYAPNQNIVNGVASRGRRRHRKRPQSASLTLDRTGERHGATHGEYASFTHDRAEGGTGAPVGRKRPPSHIERRERYRQTPTYDSSFHSSGRRGQRYNNARRSSSGSKPQIRFVQQPKYISPHTRKPTGVPIKRQELRQNRYVWQYDPSTGQIEKVDTSKENIVQSEPFIQPTQLYSSISEYAWKITGFTECSKSCGGGTQQPRVVCVLVRTQASVTVENCDGSLKPVQQTIRCNNNHCPPDWETGNWTACSVSCGLGTQTRVAECKQTVSLELRVSVSASLCSKPQPAIIQQCEVNKCSSWRVGEWSECSSRCGNGYRRRKVECVDSRNLVIVDGSCNARKPLHREKCSANTCAFDWYHSKWSNQCSSECGIGVVSRNVYCVSKEGSVVSEEMCGGRKLEKEKSCSNEMPCGGSWFTSPWGQCSTDCGRGIKRRDVLCLKRVAKGINTIVSEDNCAATNKPTNEETCEIKNCGSEWYMSTWSRCSTSCGDGYKTRSIKCLDSNQQTGHTCNESRKPLSQEACNVRSCPGVKRRDPSCEDRHSACRVVVRARLCRYRYYKRLCCASCFKAS